MIRPLCGERGAAAVAALEHADLLLDRALVHAASAEAAATDR